MNRPGLDAYWRHIYEKLRFYEVEVIAQEGDKKIQT